MIHPLDLCAKVAAPGEMNPDFASSDLVDDQGMTARLEAWFLYANVLWVLLATLLSIGLPCIALLAIVRFFS